MSQLVYRQPCEHGQKVFHQWGDGKQIHSCPGGVERVLDPDKVLRAGLPKRVDNFTVADVLAVLDREET